MSSGKLFINLTRKGKNKRLRKHIQKQQDENDASLKHTTSTSDSNLASSNLALNRDFPYSHITERLNFPSSGDNTTLQEMGLQGHDQHIYPDEVDDINDLLIQIPDSDCDDNDGGCYNICNDGDEKEKLSEDLRKWCFQYHITHVALTALLCILKSHKCFHTLPSDSRTLLKTPSSVALSVEPVSPGSYFHFGIRASIEKLWLKLNETVTTNCIDLLVGIDGLPLFKSCTGEFWPILISILNIPSVVSQIIPVGIYYGKKKPESNSVYLRAFVEEIISISNNGILLNGKKVLVKIKGFCCDAPAKAFILGIKGHNGYSSCTKCKQVGHYFCGRMTFPEILRKCDLERVLRTSEGFRRQEDPEFHNSDSILVNIPNLDFITAFPLDYMHLVCLGVTRTMLFIWMFAKPPLKFPFHLINTMSSNLQSLQSSIPCEFSRKPRGLEEIKRWKATEFRQFLLYTGPIVLKNVLIRDNEKLYNNFLHLHISMRILLSPKFCFLHKDYADELLSRFLKVFKNLYGQQFMTHNFHNLIHLSDVVTTFGSLDVCSAFRFENYLQSLKKLIRKGDKPLTQAVKRILERSNFDSLDIQGGIKQINPSYSSPHFSGPILPGCDISKQYRKLHFEHFSLSTSIPNSVCSFFNGSIAIIYNIVYSSTLHSMSVIFKRFKTYEDFYGHPFCPSSSLGIHLIGDLSDIFEIEPICQINEKIVLLPTENEKYLALPLLHIE